MQNDKKDIFDTIMGLPGLRSLYAPYQKHKSVLLYLFFGGLTTLISIGTFILFDSYCGIELLIANILSWICAVTFAYVTNRLWVFSSRVKGKELWKEAISFYSGRLATLGFEELMLWIFAGLVGLNSTLIKILAQLGVLILNYVISKIWVFRREE